MIFPAICAADRSLVNAPPLSGAPSLCSITYLSKPARRDIRVHRLTPGQPLYRWSSADYFDKLLRLENVKLFSRQDKILYILDTTILILYRKLYINMVSIIVLNIEARQYNIKINHTISCSPRQVCFNNRNTVFRYCNTLQRFYIFCLIY